ncbi:MAG: hypothetical protein CMM47_07195 [Rhodospirillaceae bacterium]|nr:hypothetical protein [Rhodospirillaceae bacterium]
MSAISYQVHVLQNRKWSLLKNFAVDDRDAAWALFSSLSHVAGYDGKKLIEEAVKDNGLLYLNTLSFKIFDPDPNAQVPSSKIQDQGLGRKTKINRSSPVRLQSQGPTAASMVNNLFGFFQTHAMKLFALDYNLFRREKTGEFSPYADPEKTNAFNRSVSGKSDAYTRRYVDESDLETMNVVRLESAEVLGTSFFDFVKRNLVTKELLKDSRFHIGICCFVVGALVKIESGLKLDSTRGKAILNDTLRIFQLDEGDIEAFIMQMAAFLSQSASTRFIKTGAQCFGSFEVGEIDQMTATFQKTFAMEKVERKHLGTGHEIGVFIVQIAELAKLREEFGSHGVQLVIDHLSQRATAVTKRHSGKVVKSLGEGVMCSADNTETMALMVKELLETSRTTGSSPDLPAHNVQVGAHFGGAVIKQGDLFGTPVQLAAVLVGIANPGKVSGAAELGPAMEHAGGSTSGASTVALPGTKGKFEVLHIV